MKKYFSYIILFSVVVLTIISESCLNGGDGLSDKLTIKDTSIISKIVIENNQDTIILTNKNNKWFINNKFPAKEQALNFLLLVSNQLKIKNPVMRIYMDSINSELELNGKTVKFYNNDNDIIKEWKVGNFDKKIGATCIKLKNTEMSFFAYLPGILHDINKIIEKKNFYETTIFDYKYYELKEIKVSYTDSSELSFGLKINNNKAELYSIKTGELMTNIDLKAVGRYLTYFEDIKFESIIEGITKAERDSILIAKPKHKITVTDRNGITKSLNTYERYNKYGKKDIHKINAIFNKNEEIIVIKYYNIDLILKELGFFLIKI